MRITRTLEKVLFHTSDGIIALSQESNLFPHPNLTHFIIVSENGSGQLAGESFSFDYTQASNYDNIPFGFTNRNEALSFFSNFYFNTQYRKPVSRFLCDIGNGTGVKNFTGNYSAALKKALIKPAGNKAIYVQRLIIGIEDSGSIDAGYYGNNIVLNNGISIKYEKESGEVLHELTDLNPIKTNADYSKIGFSIDDLVFGGGANYLRMALHFIKNGYIYRINPGEQLAIYLNDNFTGLKEHHFYAGAFYLE